MDIKQYITPLLRWWWLIVVATMVAAGASYMVVRRQPPIYQAQATLMIGRMIQDPNPNSGEFYLVQQLAAAYADIGNREPVKNKTMEALGLSWLPATWVSALPNSSLIGIYVSDTDPRRAQAVANELANQLPGLRLAWYAWWVAPNVVEVAKRHGLKPYHASWSEAFPFTRVSELPEGEKTPTTVSGLLSAQESRQAYGDGVFGGPYKVDDKIMQETFDAALADVLGLLKFDTGGING